MALNRFDKSLLATAALAVIFAAGTVAWSVSARAPIPQYAQGDAFDAVPALKVQSAERTLVVWVNTQCGACTASMPFYRRLTAENHRTRIVFMGREPVERLKDYIAGFDIHPADIISAGTVPLKFAGTPTVLLVGGDARVQAVWFGRRTDTTQEEEILKRVG